MLRPTIPEDTPELTTLTAETGFFRPDEIATLHEVLDDYHAATRDGEGHLCFTLLESNHIAGFVYFTPAPMSLGAWQLWWIVVRKETQAKGLGGSMLRFVEDEIRRRRGRLLFIETSSLPIYEPTRRFYVKYEYERHAVLKDYYLPGDDMVIYRKDLMSP